MAETLGSLCDKLTIVKLKQWHTDDAKKRRVLQSQATLLSDELDQYLTSAINGEIPADRLVFASNKVLKNFQNTSTTKALGTIGQIVANLADVNCTLWHQQEKVYDFKKIPSAEKDDLVSNLATLNLERTRCIDAIDAELRTMIEKSRRRGRR
jgi:hypothetical protein